MIMEVVSEGPCTDLSVVHAEAGAARQETVVEIIVVERDGLNQRGRHPAYICKTKHPGYSRCHQRSNTVRIRTTRKVACTTSIGVVLTMSDPQDPIHAKGASPI